MHFNIKLWDIGEELRSVHRHAWLTSQQSIAPLFFPAPNTRSAEDSLYWKWSSHVWPNLLL